MKSKLATAVLSLIIAFGLWAYVITVVSPESDAYFYNIPVVLQNDSALTDRGLMVTTENVPTVTLHLKGNRTDLNKLTSSNITLLADLSKIYETGEQSLNYTIVYPNNILNNAFTTLAQTPTQIKLNIEKRVSKQVPVKVVYEGKVPDEYMCDTENPVLDYTEVTVTGPSPVIEQIESAQILVNLTDRVESITESFRYTLCDGDGEPVDAKQVVTDVGEINLALKIQRFKEVPLKLTVVDGGGATQATSQIKIEPATIQISGSDALLEELTEVNLGTINLADLTENNAAMTFSIKLPEGITNLTNVAEAQVTVSFPDLRTVHFKVTNIQLVNVPEGLSAELVTKELQISVRGPKDLMDKMKNTDLYVTVDLTGASLGSTTVKAQVVIGSGFEAAGAIGSYSVNVTVQEAEEGKANGTGGTGS